MPNPLHVWCRATSAAVLQPQIIRQRLQQACRKSNMLDADMFKGSSVELRLFSMSALLAEKVCNVDTFVWVSQDARCPETEGMV
jgi:hypothetical protein